MESFIQREIAERRSKCRLCPDPILRGDVVLRLASAPGTFNQFIFRAHNSCMEQMLQEPVGQAFRCSLGLVKEAIPYIPKFS